MARVAVKFGVFCPRSGAESPGFDSEALNRSLRAEAQGYDSIWLGDCVGPTRDRALPLFAPAANLAARTDRIRIGVALGLRASLHPLRLSEEIAALDVITGGRIEWAAAWRDSPDGLEEARRGDARAREQIAIAVQAWTHGRIGWEGGFYTFSEVQCIPSPVQAPPPTFVLSADPAVRSWGLEAGYRLMRPPLAPFPVSNAEGGGAVLRHVYVGASHRKARDEVQESLRNAARDAGLAESEIDSDTFLDRRALVGDALYCRERIAEWYECSSFDSLILYPDFGTLPAEALHESQIRFVEEVAPAFA